MHNIDFRSNLLTACRVVLIAEDLDGLRLLEVDLAPIKILNKTEFFILSDGDPSISNFLEGIQSEDFKLRGMDVNGRSAPGTINVPFMDK